MNKKYLAGLYKRAFIIFVFLIPVFVILDNLLGPDTADFTKISLFVLVAGLSIVVVELVRNRKSRR